jgi:hypothetical protein
MTVIEASPMAPPGILMNELADLEYRTLYTGRDAYAKYAFNHLRAPLKPSIISD